MFKEIYDLFGNWKERYKDISLKMRLSAAIDKMEGSNDSLRDGLFGIFGCSEANLEYQLSNMGLEDVIHTLNKVCVYQQREINRLKEVIRYMNDIGNYNQHGRLNLEEVNKILDKEL